MSEHLQLITRKLEHLDRMRGYLAYSLNCVQHLLPIEDWSALQQKDHQTLAAFRVRFSEFQEHIGKLMRAIAIEEEQKTEPFTAVLLYMEKLEVIDSVTTWKDVRELRNAINHEYEENPERIAQFFSELALSTQQLFDWHEQIKAFCQTSYQTQIQ